MPLLRGGGAWWMPAIAHRNIDIPGMAAAGASRTAGALANRTASRADASERCQHRIALDRAAMTSEGCGSREEREGVEQARSLLEG